jgi:peptidoglycan/LPS O-acetylase OafA/YrhL
MSYPQALSVAVYIISAGVFTAAILFSLQGKAWRVKALLLGLLLACILFVVVLELPITRMPFWSRDFSLTWTMAVLALAVAVVSLRPRIFGSMRKRFGKCPEASVSPLSGTESTMGTSSSQKVVCTSVGIPNGRVEPTPSATRRTTSQAMLFLGLLGAGVVLATLYWRGAEQNLIRANTDPTRVDQGAYINYTEKILEWSYPGLVDS